MAAKTGSTYNSESMASYHQIFKGKPKFSTTASLKIVSVGNSNNDRQREMAADTGSTYISGTVTDSVEIPTANLTFSTMQNSVKCSQVIGQRRTVGNGKIGDQNIYIAISGCRSLSQSPGGQFV